MSEKSRDELDREDTAASSEPDAATDAPEALAQDELGDSTPAIVRKTAKAPVKKDRPTRKRGEAETDHDDPYKAHNPAEFVKQSADELNRVVWPTWPQTLTMFSAVLVFVLIIIAIVGVLDLAFGWSLLKLFGS